MLSDLRKPGTNTGHGQVWPRPDGRRSRCGGPRLCEQCRADATQWKRVVTYVNAATGEAISLGTQQ
jgi:hypothetical protein